MIVCDDLDWDFGSDKDEWLVLQIGIKGFDHEQTDINGHLVSPRYNIVLYRNLDDYIRLKDYDLARKEHP